MNDKTDIKQDLKLVIKTLPEQPGIYQYFDERGNIIYIGKAKNLKKRVSSYFNKETHDYGKTRVMVSKIAKIQYMVVDNEWDALLLENNLIKKDQPRYNIMLKDDKTFPWICIKNEAFPRIFHTRHIIKDGSEYFGPYASVKLMHTLLELIRKLYPIRNCKLNLSKKNIEAKKYRVCLEYHIKNCKGPCQGYQSEEDYNQTISQIKEIIKGNISNVLKQLRELMMRFASEMEFEKAQAIKEKYEHLENYKSKSTIVNPSIRDVDVFSIVDDKITTFVNYLKIIDGAIVQTHTVELKRKLNETTEQLLLYSIVELYSRFNSSAKEIVLPFSVELPIPNVKITIPRRGDKKQLLDLSARNAKHYKLEQQRQQELVDPERHTNRILQQMMKDLRLSVLPRHIECFDNSNIQGAHPVAALVVFKDERPDKKEYRHFNIKTVEGPNDFASMEEVIYRRYKRLIEEKLPLPQLIIVDGGKGQLSSAIKSLEKLSLRGKIGIIGIAKKLEEIYFPEDTVPLYLDKKSETLKLIQQIRNEAHRFGISHHRKKRDKATIKSVLTEIDGIGFATAQSLLRKFKSVKNIQKASFEEISNVIGKSKASIVKNFFENKN